MSTMMITLIGTEKTLNNHDMSLFDNVVLPPGFDFDTLKNTVLLRGAEFEVLYSNLGFFRDAVPVWFKSHYRTFEKWINAINTEYKPLENYSMTEKFTDTTESDFNNHNTVTYGRTDRENVSAFDSATYSPNSESVAGGNDKTDANGGANSTITHEGGRFGNIGVTTSQQMLESELKVAEWNVYNHVADLFIQDFCLPVY